MKTYTIQFLLLGLFLTAGCHREKSPLGPNDDNLGPFGSGAEYEIYSVVVNSMFLWKNTKLAVLIDSTVTYELSQNSIEYYQQQFPKLDKFLIEDFNKNNADRQKLLNIPGLEATDVLISDNELDDIFQNGWWPEFYKRFPNSSGYISLSSIGFSQNENTAFLYASSIQGGLAGAGYVILLQKTDLWKVVKTLMVWIS
jgi:hypothetical protein